MVAVPLPDAVLAGLEPALVPGTFVFTSVQTAPAGSEWTALVAEDEGLTCVLRRPEADRLGLQYDYVAAMISLGRQTSLDLVGLTAKVATVLAEAGISCNVIAGRHHDHLFVPAERAIEAVRLLEALQLPGVADPQGAGGLGPQ